MSTCAIITPAGVLGGLGGSCCKDSPLNELACWARLRESHLASHASQMWRKGKHEEGELEGRGGDGPLRPVERKVVPMHGSRCCLGATHKERLILPC